MSKDEKIFTSIYALCLIVDNLVHNNSGVVEDLNSLMRVLKENIQKEQEVEKAAENFSFDVLFPGIMK